MQPHVLTQSLNTSTCNNNERELVKSALSHHLEGVQESGELVKPLSTIGRHSIVNEPIQFIDVCETQFVEVLLTLQTLNWNCWKQPQNMFDLVLSAAPRPVCVDARYTRLYLLMLKRSRAFMQRNSSWVICSSTNSCERCLIRMQCSYIVETCIRCLRM